ncbi:MAG: DUF2973 domain-containing protein [Cyanobacteriota bacterium]|nr:DUF2973 domain-containing protein [Cyanobacteriota bacterium]
MPSFLSDLFPFLYGICFLLLLWQAFRTMARGFRAMGGNSSVEVAGTAAPASDRTGRLTIHPELLDAEGRLTAEELLTVRFSGDNEPAPPDGDSP